MFPRSPVVFCLSAAVWLLFGAPGCASHQYQAGQGWRHKLPPCSLDSGQSALVIETGKPHKLLDGTGWVLGIPAKILLWNRRVDNHHISEQTVAEVAAYLEQNQLQDVCFRVNQYAPGDEWRRLCQNKEVGAGWRYTMGTLTVLHYTLLPGRLIGRDRYNPYTNSLYLYSDVAALGIQSAAYAKDVHNRQYPGTYAFVNEFPIVALWHETIATEDALAYYENYSNPDQRTEAIEVLYPYYGLRVGGAIGVLSGIGPIIDVGGALVGHGSGRYRAYRMESREEPGWVSVSDDNSIQIVRDESSADFDSESSSLQLTAGDADKLFDASTADGWFSNAATEAD